MTGEQLFTAIKLHLTPSLSDWIWQSPECRAVYDDAARFIFLSTSRGEDPPVPTPRTAPPLHPGEPSAGEAARSPNAMPRRHVEDALTEWIKAALRFIDRCASDVADYSDDGLFDDTQGLILGGFELFGLKGESSLSDLEHSRLAVPAPAVVTEIYSVLHDTTGELFNLHFNVAGPRTFAAIDRLDDLLKLVNAQRSKDEPHPDNASGAERSDASEHKPPPPDLLAEVRSALDDIEADGLTAWHICAAEPSEATQTIASYLDNIRASTSRALSKLNEGGE